MDSIYDLSAQLSYMFSDDRYRITVYGKNLTDERELYNANDWRYCDQRILERPKNLWRRICHVRF